MSKELQAEVTRLTDMSTLLAEMLNAKIDECEELTDMNLILANQLNAKIDECTKLEEELEMLGPLIKEVEVTTDFGPDIVFATVKCMCDIPFVQTEVVSWSLDGQPQPLDSLKGEDEFTLRKLAREKVNES